ncbi:MAG TPA: hypothetical protein VN894_19585, partial [Polyangiaceae bacterium]|nr:hypothetical protein [Polyangiaceae bacterium]
MNKSLFLGICIAAVLAVGCVVAAGPAPFGGVVAVSGPPPEPVQEIRPPPLRPRAAWVPGYWHWTG